MPSVFRVFRSLDEIPPDFGPSAVTIGNFDGVHAGHRRILRRIVSVAAARGLKASAVTFDPHPATVVAPSRAPVLLTTPQQRAGLMRAGGIEQVLIVPFDLEFSRITPERFAREVLAGRLGARVVLVGENFRFGHRHAGDTRLLKELGAGLGFETEIVPAVKVRGVLVSSSAVRKLISSGDVSRAARLLEKPYALEGRVVPGQGVGSRQTVPTLNLEPPGELLPRTGVYITRTEDPDHGRHWPSVTNVGYRPTFHGDRLTIETFLLAWLSGDPPGRIRVEFLKRLRDERRFPSAAELKNQILRDVARAQAFFRRCGKWAKAASAAG
ncbi:MAG: bifunctional riboflavin kinase/FAD synthetase [Bryobacterales bacterium]|nr:bifunctional riboflavin kinase/FAD synthetase [Bryobacterales bacterium]